MVTKRNEAEAMHRAMAHWFRQMQPWRRRRVLVQLQRIHTTLPARTRAPRAPR